MVPPVEGLNMNDRVDRLQVTRALTQFVVPVLIAAAFIVEMTGVTPGKERCRCQRAQPRLWLHRWWLPGPAASLQAMHCPLEDAMCSGAPQGRRFFHLDGQGSVSLPQRLEASTDEAIQPHGGRHYRL